MSLEQEINKDAFRDTIATISDEGKRNFIRPKKPGGFFTKYRTQLSWVLLILLFSGPWIKIGDEPLLMINVLERKFVIFGQIFWPQDFYLFVVGMLTMVVFVVVFTVIYGRIFCGWVCPQTIFMEMVFRKIEYWLEGDWQKQKKLDKMPWNAEKIKKRTTKHVIFLFISVLISHTFLAYIIGTDDLIELISAGPSAGFSGFIALAIFTFLFYGVFSWFREQVCLVVCPYGRLQGVLIDSKTIIVAYDFVRGENRGKFKRREDRKEEQKGDCIDCHACVDVCPTGIDIRNGTQLECINCTACIDACDAIMDKVGFEKGLIRYASEEQIKEKKPFKFTIRMKAYTIVLGVLTSLLLVLLSLRTDVETKILSPRGALYNMMDDGRVSNIYTYKVLNKTTHAIDVSFEVEDNLAELKMIGAEPHAETGEYAEGAIMLILDRDKLDGIETDLNILVRDKDRILQTIEIKFMGPMN